MAKGVYDHSHIVPWNKGLKGFRQGVRHSLETRMKIAASHRGMTHSQETKEKLSRLFKGKPIKEETRRKIQATMRAKFAGIKNLEGTTRARSIRKSYSYREWRSKVLELFNYTCVLCGEQDKSKLCADHIKPLRLFPELALDVSNGRVVCNICHLRLPTHGSHSKGLT